MLVEFLGPFSWLDRKEIPSIFMTPEGKRVGIYLWTVSSKEGELIYYVGQTGRNFSERMLEHFEEHMSGGYHIYEPNAFLQGQKILLWPGRFGTTANRSISDFMERLLSLAPTISRLTEIYRFFIAPLECDKRIRERIESGLANHLYKQKGIVGDFQEKGVRYSSRREDENPIEIEIQCRDCLLGLPRTLWI